MTDLPIIFSAPMVLALLAGRKTMTRRLAWRSEEWRDVLASERLEDLELRGLDCQEISGRWRVRKPSPWQKVQPGDRLWVRESGIRFRTMTDSGWTGLFRHDVPATAEFGHYWIEDRRGPGASYNVAGCSRAAALTSPTSKACPSIHMPRWASRLTLIVEAVKVEPLQAISEEDAIAEGVERASPPHPGYRHYGERDGLPGIVEIDSFKTLWGSIHGTESWAANPDVVAVSFRVIPENIDRIKEAA